MTDKLKKEIMRQLGEYQLKAHIKRLTDYKHIRQCPTTNTIKESDTL